MSQVIPIGEIRSISGNSIKPVLTGFFYETILGFKQINNILIFAQI
jgi:hypothetical protein